MCLGSVVACGVIKAPPTSHSYNVLAIYRPQNFCDGIFGALWACTRAVPWCAFWQQARLGRTGCGFRAVRLTPEAVWTGVASGFLRTGVTAIQGSTRGSAQHRCAGAPVCFDRRGVHCRMIRCCVALVGSEGVAGTSRHSLSDLLKRDHDNADHQMQTGERLQAPRRSIRPSWRGVAHSRKH